METLQDLINKVKKLLTDARDIAASAEKENRNLTDEERGQVKAKLDEATDIKKQIDRRKGDDELRKAVDGLGDDVGINNDPLSGVKNLDPNASLPNRPKSLGQAFTESQAYKSLLSTRPGGQFGEKQRVQSDPYGLKSFFPSSSRKSLVTGVSDTSAGAGIQPQWLGYQVGLDPFLRPLRLRDLVTSGTTSTDQIDYALVTGIVNNAAPVAEATSTAAGGVKPESGFTTAKASTTVKTIAHWLPVTKRALSDAAQIRTLIDAFLEYGLEEELEDQMVAGDGTGENFLGIQNTSGVQVQAADATGVTAADKWFRTFRKAKTKVRLVGRSQANGYIINPNDTETLDLFVDANDRYYSDGPFGGAGVSALWGVPIVESEAVPQGTSYVGDWRRAILWDREQSSITVSDSHADFFIRNLVAILAELRAAFAILQPSAFVKITLPATP